MIANYQRRLFAFSLGDSLSFGIIFPLLPYYVESFGASPIAIGFIAAIYSLMQFVFSPIWGRYSDKVGRKPVILISLIGTSFSLLLSALSPSITVLFISRLLAGFFTAASLPTTYAYVADFTKEEERAEKFGMLGAAWGLGFILGPALGGLLSNVSIHAPFYIASFVALLNFIFSYIFLPSINKVKEIHQVEKEGVLNLSAIVRHLKGEVGIFFILFFVAAFTLSGLEVVFPLFSKWRFHFNETNIGFFFTFIGIVVGLTQGVFVGKFVKKYGELKTIVLAHICMMIGYAAIAFSGSISFLVLSAGILAFGIALNEPCLAALISKLQLKYQGGLMGEMWSCNYIGRTLGPMISAYIYLNLLNYSLFLINSFLFSITLILFIPYLMRSAREYNNVKYN